MAIDFEKDQDPSMKLGLAEKVEVTPVTEIEIVQGPAEVGTEDQPTQDGVRLPE